MYKKKIPWIEKYRPKQLTDIIYQTETIEIFNNTLKMNNLPHLLLYGPPGTGKTTTILIIANILFGPEKMHDRVIELNASDDRGINVVRTKIMNFAKENLSTPDPNYPSPPFKIIILDEADAMTKEAQSALKKIIEINSKITRFCLICNYITKIIDPIQSRCSKLRFKSIKPILMCDRLKFIAENENLNVTNNNLKIIAEKANGDMRKAIMYLQNLKYIINQKNELTDDDVYKITNYINPSFIKVLIEDCLTKNNNLDKIIEKINVIWREGYVINNILETVTNIIIESDKLNDKQKEYICFHNAAIDRLLINGADEFIQLYSIFSFIKAIYNNVDINKSIDIL